MNNRYLDGFLATEIVSRLNENSRRELVNKLDEQNYEELEKLVSSKIGADKISTLSAQLQAHFESSDYNFKSVLKEMLRAHRCRKLDKMIIDHGNQLKGEVLVIDMPPLLEFEVLDVHFTDMNTYGKWELVLADQAKMLVLVREKHVSDVEIEMFERCITNEYVTSLIRATYITRHSYIRIDGRDASIVPGFYMLELKAHFKQRYYVVIGSFVRSYRFALRRRNIDASSYSNTTSYFLDVICSDDNIITSVELFDGQHSRLPFSLERFNRLKVAVKKLHYLNKKQSTNILVKKKVVSADEIKLRKMATIDKLQDEVVFLLLSEDCHIFLNSVLHELKTAEGIHVERLTSHLLAKNPISKAINKKINAIKDLSDSLNEQAAPVQLAAIFKQLIHRANYLRWTTRTDSLSVLKAMALFDQFKADLEILHEKDLVLFLGNTGAGKSTCVNYFLGNPLCSDAYCGEAILRIDTSKLSRANTQVAKIGQSIGTSETAFTKGFSILQEAKESFANDGIANADKVMLVDSPGFNDTRGVNFQMLTMLSIQQTIQCAANIRAAVLVIDYNLLNVGRSLPLYEAFNSFRDMFPTAFDDASPSSRSVYVLITKCGKPDDMEAHFETRFQQIITEEEQQLIRQREAGAYHDASDTESRIKLWRLLMKWKQTNQIIYVDPENSIRRHETLAQFIKSPGIPKESVRNIFETRELQTKLTDYVNLSANTNMRIIESFLRGLPSDLDGANKLTEFKMQELKKNEERMQEKIRRETALSKSLSETMEKITFFETADLNDATIMQQLEELVLSIRSKSIEEAHKDIEYLEKCLQQLRNDVNTIKEEREKRNSDIVKFWNDISELESLKGILETGVSLPITLFHWHVKKGQRLRVNREREGALDKAREQSRQLSSNDIENTEFVDPTTYTGTGVVHAYIEREFYILPERQNESEILLKNSRYAMYEASVSGHKYSLKAAKHGDRCRIVYQFDVTFDGREPLPEIKIQCCIPNQDLNNSSIQNLASEIDELKGLIACREAEVEGLNSDLESFQNEIAKMQQSLIKRREMLRLDTKHIAIRELKDRMDGTNQQLEEVRDDKKALAKAISDIENQISQLKERSTYLLTKRLHFAMIVREQLSVMESLSRLCGFLSTGSLSRDHNAMVPYGFLKQCQDYNSLFEKDKHQLILESQKCFQKDISFLTGEQFFMRFQKDVPSWGEFAKTFPVEIDSDGSLEDCSSDDPDPGSSRQVPPEKWKEELVLLINRNLDPINLNVKEIFDSQISSFGFNAKHFENEENSGLLPAVIDQLVFHHRQTYQSSVILGERLTAFIAAERESFCEFIDILETAGMHGYVTTCKSTNKFLAEPILSALSMLFDMELVLIGIDEAKPLVIRGTIGQRHAMYLGFTNDRFVSLHGEPNDEFNRQVDQTPEEFNKLHASAQPEPGDFQDPSSIKTDNISGREDRPNLDHIDEAEQLEN